MANVLPLQKFPMYGSQLAGMHSSRDFIVNLINYISHLVIAIARVYSTRHQRLVAIMYSWLQL